MSNNIRDIEEDIKGGRKTLAILLGQKKGIIALAIAFVGVLFMDRGSSLIGYISPWTLVVFLSVKKPILAIQGFLKGAAEPQYLRVAMKSTAMTNTFFGFLLSAGLLISYLF